MIHVESLLADLEAAYLRDPAKLRDVAPWAFEFFRRSHTDMQQWLHLRSFITPTIPPPKRQCHACGTDVET